MAIYIPLVVTSRMVARCKDCLDKSESDVFVVAVHPQLPYRILGINDTPLDRIRVKPLDIARKGDRIYISDPALIDEIKVVKTIQTRGDYLNIRADATDCGTKDVEDTVRKRVLQLLEVSEGMPIQV